MMRQSELGKLLAVGATVLFAAGLTGCGGAIEGEAEAEAETEAVSTGTGSADDPLAAVARSGGGAPAVAAPEGVLRGHWKLDETSGTDAASATGSNNGTLRYLASTAWTAGRVGGALTFNGSGYVRVRHDKSLTLTKEITLAAWIYLTSASGDQNVVQKGDNFALFEIREGGTPQNVIDVGGDENWETFKYTKNASWFLNAWHHVAFTYDGAKAVNYIDGEQDGEARPQTGEMATNYDWLGIGTNGAWADAFFKGKIDDARVYAKALTAAEIKKVCQEGGM